MTIFCHSWDDGGHLPDGVCDIELMKDSGTFQELMGDLNWKHENLKEELI